MATIRFSIKGKQDPSNIYVRLRDGRKYDFVAVTGLTISPKHWSNEKHWVKHLSDFHDKLNLENTLKKIETTLYTRRNERISKRLSLDIEWFKDTLAETTSQHETETDHLITLLENYKNRLSKTIRNGRKVSAGALRNYNTTCQRLKKYEDHFKTKIYLSEVNLDFHANYLRFAQDVLNLSINSIGKDFKQIKTICFDARDSGKEVNPMSISRKFNSPTEKTVFTTLNESELKRILEYSGPDYLNNARDWLIIGCWTGCRVGDLMKLNESNLKDYKSTKIIQYTQSKTGKQVNVPIHPQVLQILDRLSGFPRPISDVMFNKFIKEVGKRAGLKEKVKGSRQNPKTHKKETGEFEKWELIRSHICRRSFASNHYNRLPNKVIMAVTGHATERMLLSYIGQTEIEHLENYLDLWKQ